MQVKMWEKIIYLSILNKEVMYLNELFSCCASETLHAAAWSGCETGVKDELFLLTHGCTRGQRLIAVWGSAHPVSVPLLYHLLLYDTLFIMLNKKH